MSTMRQQDRRAHGDVASAPRAHVTTVHRVDMTKVAKMREQHKATSRRSYGFSLTYLPFITRAAVEALRAVPAAQRVASTATTSSTTTKSISASRWRSRTA